MTTDLYPKRLGSWKTRIQHHPTEVTGLEAHLILHHQYVPEDTIGARMHGPFGLAHSHTREHCGSGISPHELHREHKMKEVTHVE